jgi:hypothetical protein
MADSLRNRAGASSLASDGAAEGAWSRGGSAAPLPLAPAASTAGLTPRVRQIRLMAVWVRPTAWAIERVVQADPLGARSAVSRMTRATCSSVMRRGAPGRGSS